MPIVLSKSLHKIPELPEDLTVYFCCLVGMCNVTSGSLEGGVAASLRVQKLSSTLTQLVKSQWGNHEKTPAKNRVFFTNAFWNRDLCWGKPSVMPSVYVMNTSPPNRVSFFKQCKPNSFRGVRGAILVYLPEKHKVGALWYKLPTVFLTKGLTTKDTHVHVLVLVEVCFKGCCCCGGWWWWGGWW